jgi:hypothetical protein
MLVIDLQNLYFPTLCSMDVGPGGSEKIRFI